MQRVTNFRTELKHPFLKAYTIMYGGLLVDVIKTKNSYYVSDIRDYNFIAKLSPVNILNVDFVKISKKQELRYSEQILSSTKYDDSLEKIEK